MEKNENILLSSEILENIDAVKLSTRYIIDNASILYSADLIYAHKRLSQQLSEGILNNKKFYKTEEIRNQYTYIEANCIVFTNESLTKFAIEMYEKGKNFYLNFQKRDTYDR